MKTNRSFNRKTKQLIQTSKNGRISIADFSNAFPGIAAQIQRDRGSRIFKYWGESKNFDELAGAKIVDPKLLTTIGRIARYPIRRRQKYHAGLIHTYGYLLSTLKTAFGYKRQRWTSTIIESGFGLNGRCLSPETQSGTLLANVTYFLARIALDSVNKADFHHIPDVLETFCFPRLSGVRLLERCDFSDPQQQQKKITLRTDVVDFCNPKSSLSSLLIYSVSINQSQRLATCFPIDSAKRADVERLACDQTSNIVLRYNLAIDGFPKNGIQGRRSLTPLKL